jgi:hypothetical protein
MDRVRPAHQPHQVTFGAAAVETGREQWSGRAEYLSWMQAG